MGVWRYYAENGKPLVEFLFVNGVKNGPTTHWQDNGIQAYEGAQKADKKNGTFRCYDEEGELTKTEEYKTGQRNRVKVYPSKAKKKRPGRH